MENRILKEIRKNGLFIEDDVYQYGMFILIHYLIYAIFSFIICLYLGCVKEMVIFCTSFSILRKYVGGFHFDNSKICTFFTIFFTTLFSFLASKIQINLFLFLFIIFFTRGLINKTGCIDHKNKKLSYKEKNVYKNRAMKIITIYSIIGFITKLFGIIIVVNVLGIMLIFIFSIILIGAYSNEFQKKGEENNENCNI